MNALKRVLVLLSLIGGFCLDGADERTPLVSRRANHADHRSDTSFSRCIPTSMCYGAGLLTMIVVLSSPAAVDYKVYNREPYPIDVLYRPGCYVYNEDHLTDIDCVESIDPGKSIKITSIAGLSTLCARSWNGWFSPYSYGCTTQKGLEIDYNWYVHDALKFSRGDGLQKMTPGNVTNDTKKIAVNFTDNEMQKMKSDLVKTQNDTTLYLRGSVK